MIMDGHIIPGSIDWQNLLHGDFPYRYLFEIAVRTAIMFLFLLFVLKFLSKRGVKQLSVFELAILIALGSATGDPMFYKHVPVLHGIMVLGMVILLYKTITFLTARSKGIEIALEGKPVCLLENGRINYDHYKTVGLPYDKFFGELRLHGISHLGEVKKVYLETSGELSVYSFRKDEVIPGLPIFPELISQPKELIDTTGTYACIYCGNIESIATTGHHECAICRNNKWIVASAD